MREALRPGERAIDARLAMMPVVGAAVMVVLFGVYYWLLAAPEPIGHTMQEVVHEQHKVLWGSSSLVLNLAMLWCLGVCVFASDRYADVLPPAAWRMVWGLVVAAVVIAAGLATRAGFVGGNASGAILGDLFEAASGVGWIVGANNVVGTPIVLLMILASVILSRHVRSCTPSQLGERVRWFRALLYSAGALLATAIYQFFRLYDWGATVQAPDGTHAGLASSLALASGILLSCFLAVVFLPSAILLHHRMDDLVGEAAQGVAEFDRGQWTAEHRVGGSPLTAMGSYVALILPMLSGFLTRVLEV